MKTSRFWCAAEVAQVNHHALQPVRAAMDDDPEKNRFGAGGHWEGQRDASGMKVFRFLLGVGAGRFQSCQFCLAKY
jgi:hypothetical protein